MIVFLKIAANLTIYINPENILTFFLNTEFN